MATTTYNLSQFCKSIEHVEGARELIGMVATFHGPCAQYQDLTFVRSYLDELLRIDRGDVAEASVLGASLFMSAVITYCRAAKDGQRKRVDLTRPLNSELREKHDHICAVRDTVMAHYEGALTSRDGFEWVEEVTYLEESEGAQTRGLTAFNRANYLAAEVNDLQELLTVIGPFLNNEIAKRREPLLAKLRQMRANPEIERQLRACQFDVVEWVHRERRTEGAVTAGSSASN
ncbi:hypothetical protein [Rhizobium leguminosarum]|uniref:hypothetical protein n=1 Tax=Rhizobium leguminosarum TaxID=384 RepID=UPI00103C9CD3|nr:hypothetical protein [Rhizobium leguminosarum]TBY41169.1 hypothetical protein E0H60_09590 [Rhizobium leguminosarum bv. viciae]